MIANTWLALLRHPSELMLLKEHPEWIVGAVEEGLRYDPPTQAPNPLAATSDVDVGGKIIRKGQPVTVLIGAVNRDSGRSRSRSGSTSRDIRTGI